VEIEDSFRVDLPVDETWNLLMDIERIAPCLPGAQLKEIAGEEYRGVVKVKVGPITAQYKGAAHIETRDDDAHTAVIVGNGRDTRGQGNASATITMRCTEAGGGTTVEVLTDLSITGKVAQFGRGVMADVSAKLLAQFVENLERDVLAAPDVDLAAAESEVETGADDALEPPTTDVVAPVGSSNGSHSADGDVVVRRIDAPEVEPVDLFEVGGSSVLKRLLPLAAVGLVLVLVLRRLRRSARRG
jgi:carbon monoxide dehydrogenase subunit G